jgi:hypothetical protein
MKQLIDISWQVSEEEYRRDTALSYSLLAKFEREGFSSLPHLFDKVETPSLTFGSAVDALITGGEEEFNSKFKVITMPECPPAIQKASNMLFEQYKESSITKIDNDTILNVLNSIEYQKNWKDETRVKVFKEKADSYYTYLSISEGKTILSSDTYEDVDKAVCALRDFGSPSYKYFQVDSPYDSVKRYYQLKFKASFDNIDYRCMADLLYVDYDNKVIIPVDLKTSGHYEWEFEKSFIQWMYFIQARLYWRIIRAAMDKDDYFKDFTLEDYRFIVINRYSVKPLVWRFPYTTYYGTLTDSKGNLYRDPFEIGKELSYYLTHNSVLPELRLGIEETIINEIKPYEIKN